MMGTEQLNMIIHNDLRAGHFRATVVVGTTLSFMALTYFLIPVLFKREMIALACQFSHTCSACRCTSSVLVMMGAGTLAYRAGTGIWRSTVRRSPTNGRVRLT